MEDDIMATREEMLTVAEKIARKKRKNPDLNLVDELKKGCFFLTNKEGRNVASFLNQIILVCFYLKRSFPNGRINKSIALRKLGYSEDYFAFRVAINIINDEEKGKPMSNYIYIERNKSKCPNIDYGKYY